MSNELANFNPAEFEVAIADIAKGASSRVEFLRMDKTGMWTFGIDENDVDEDTPVYVDPTGFVRGWQCWADTDIPGVQAELLGNVFVGMGKPRPARPDEIPTRGRAWAEMLGMSLLIEGRKLTYTTTSVGGLGAVAKLAELIAAQWRKDQKKFIPVIHLGSDSYKHKKYGKIYVPIFEVVGWVDRLPEQALAPDPAPVRVVEPPPPVPAAKKAAPKKTTVKASPKRAA